MKTFCYIPEICIVPGAEISTLVRRQLGSAMKAGLLPAGLPGAVKRIVIDIDATVLADIKLNGHVNRLAPGKVIGGLLYAQHLAGPAAAMARSANANAGPAPLTVNLRAGQERTLVEAVPFMRAGKVVLAECGTGSGKSRLIAHMAEFITQLRRTKLNPTIALTADTLDAQAKPLPSFLQTHLDKVRAKLAGQTKTGPIIVSAPSIENIAHLLKEWEIVKPVLDPQGLLKTTVVLGRAQFVSPTALLQVLEKYSGDKTAILRWLGEGMPTGVSNASMSLGNAIPGLRGLMDDLRTLTDAMPDFKLHDLDVAINDDTDIGERSLYDALRDLDHTSRCDVVFTTHAMLCLDNMMLARADMPQLLPLASAILIDEAHLLEVTQANMASKSISFHRLASVMGAGVWDTHAKRKLAASIKGMAVTANAILQNIPNGTKLPISSFGADGSSISEDFSRQTWARASTVLTGLSEALKKIQPPKTAKKSSKPDHDTQPSGLTDHMKAALLYCEQCLEALQYVEQPFNGSIEHSPVKSSVSFVLGPKSVAKYLVARWAVSPCAMLVSGTLLHYTESGPVGWQIAQELAIPSARIAMVTPLNPSWLSTTPTLVVPQASEFHLLMPPSRKTASPATEQVWFDNVALAMGHIGKVARGGSLVLCSGYDRAKGMADAFRSLHPEMADRVILQERSKRVGPCRDQFKEMHAAEVIKPIWFACGGAWTGLDLKDETVADAMADQDLLLTDLVMPALPFGMESNTTAIARRDRLGFHQEIVTTQRRTRQGIGRLIRREGLLHRNLWMLDGRLQHPDSGFTTEIRHWLGRYVKHGRFSLPI